MRSQPIILTLFGDFSAQYQETLLTTFRSDKIRALFAYLAVEADRPHRRETLATLFWAEMSDSVAKRNLRQSLHRLKQTIGLDADWLEMTRQTVLLRGEWVETDIGRFQAHLTQCQTHPHKHLHACTDCLQQLTAAVTLYRGPFLQGLTLTDALGFEEWQTVERERLHQQALTALDLLTHAHEKRGDLEQALTFAQRQIELEPWRESAHRQVMRLLALQGQRDEAIAQFERCRTILLQAFGVAPVQKTLDLHAQIEAGTFENNQPAATTLYHFPTYFTPFVGRSAEITQLTQQLADPDCRLLTIVGSGGMGKTRLADAIGRNIAQTSEQFPDGILFASFAAVESADSIIPLIAANLGIALANQASPLDQITRLLADKQQLWILDNLEQLTAQAATILDLLRAIAGLKIIVTSREALRLQAEWLFTLDGLAFQPTDDGDSDAERLFWRVAKQQKVGLEVTQADLQAARKICQWVHGMPLALEMLATWVRHMSVGEIAQQVGNLDLLELRFQHIPERQRNLRTVFESTWQMLPAAAQAAATRLTVFRGSFDIDALMSVANVALSDLYLLLDKFMLSQAVPQRFAFHPLLWQFSAEKVTDAVAPIAAKHAEYYLTQLLVQGERLKSNAAAAAAQRIELEWDNIWQAWQWAVQQHAWESLRRAAPALADFALHRLLLPSAQAALDLAQNALALAPHTPANRHALAIVQWQAAHLYGGMHRFDAAAELLRNALTNCSRADFLGEFGRILTELGIMQWRLGNYDQAQQLLQEALQIAEQTADSAQIPYIMHHQANVLLTIGDYTSAEPLYTHAIMRLQADDNLPRTAAVLGDYGLLKAEITRLSAMTNQFEDANYAATAIPDVERSYAIYAELKHRSGKSLTGANLALLHLLSGNYVAAEHLLNELINGNFTIVYISVYLHLGHALHLQGRNEEAVHNYRLVLQDRKQGARLEDAYALTWLAKIRLEAGESADALILLSAADQLRQTFIILDADYYETAVWQQSLASAKSAVTPAEFDRCWAVGQAMSLAEMIALSTP